VKKCNHEEGESTNVSGAAMGSDGDVIEIVTFEENPMPTLKRKTTPSFFAAPSRHPSSPHHRAHDLPANPLPPLTLHVKKNMPLFHLRKDYAGTKQAKRVKIAFSPETGNAPGVLNYWFFPPSGGIKMAVNKHVSYVGLRNHCQI